jgi:uncharacterized protein YxjI
MRYAVRERFFSLSGNDNDITDEGGTARYKVDGNSFSARSEMIVNDAEGKEVANIHRKLVSLLTQYEAEIGGQGTAIIKKQMTAVKPKWTINVPGQEECVLAGDLMARNFTMQRGETEVASVSHKWTVLRNTYGVDVADGENDLLVLCTVLALEADSHWK